MMLQISAVKKRNVVELAGIDNDKIDLLERFGQRVVQVSLMDLRLWGDEQFGRLSQSCL